MPIHPFIYVIQSTTIVRNSTLLVPVDNHRALSNDLLHSTHNNALSVVCSVQIYTLHLHMFYPVSCWLHLIITLFFFCMTQLSTLAVGISVFQDADGDHRSQLVHVTYVTLRKLMVVNLVCCCPYVWRIIT
jgi:hypothetical protein